MRKLIFQILITADGYFEGPNRQLEWHVWDEEMEAYASELFSTVDTLLFGRITYEIMAAFWPTPASLTENEAIRSKMNNLPKVVFSKTIKTAEWNNTRLVKTDAVIEITKLKQQAGKDLIIFGSSAFASSLIHHHVIDEYQLIVNPIFLGSGRGLFETSDQTLGLRLISSKVFRCGNVLLTYHPDRFNNFMNDVNIVK